jgi:hypothetical protein
MTAVPTPADLATLDDEQLEALAVAWRTRALQGDKSANGMAHALEVERRRRLRESQFAELDALPPEGASQSWWQFWKRRGDA